MSPYPTVGIVMKMHQMQFCRFSNPVAGNCGLVFIRVPSDRLSPYPKVTIKITNAHPIVSNGISFRRHFTLFRKFWLMPL